MAFEKPRSDTNEKTNHETTMTEEESVGPLFKPYDDSAEFDSQDHLVTNKARISALAWVHLDLHTEEGLRAWTTREKRKLDFLRSEGLRKPLRPEEYKKMFVGLFKEARGGWLPDPLLDSPNASLTRPFNLNDMQGALPSDKDIARHNASIEAGAHVRRPSKPKSTHVDPPLRLPDPDDRIFEQFRDMHWQELRPLAGLVEGLVKEEDFAAWAELNEVDIASKRKNNFQIEKNGEAMFEKFREVFIINNGWQCVYSPSNNRPGEWTAGELLKIRELRDLVQKQVTLVEEAYKVALKEPSPPGVIRRLDLHNRELKNFLEYLQDGGVPDPPAVRNQVWTTTETGHRRPVVHPGMGEEWNRLMADLHVNSDINKENDKDKDKE